MLVAPRHRSGVTPRASYTAAAQCTATPLTGAATATAERKEGIRVSDEACGLRIVETFLRLILIYASETVVNSSGRSSRASVSYRRRGLRERDRERLLRCRSGWTNPLRRGDPRPLSCSPRWSAVGAEINGAAGLLELLALLAAAAAPPSRLCCVCTGAAV